MGIFSILLVVFLQVFSLAIDSQNNSRNTSAISQDSKYFITRVSYDISRAQTIISPILGEESSILQFAIDGDTYTYSLANTDLTLAKNSEIYKLNSINTTVSNLTFKRFGNSTGKNAIQTQFTLTGVIQESIGLQTETFQTTIGQR